jgi:hypothetical protein
MFKETKVLAVLSGVSFEQDGLQVDPKGFACWHSVTI